MKKIIESYSQDELSKLFNQGKRFFLTYSKVFTLELGKNTGFTLREIERLTLTKYTRKFKTECYTKRGRHATFTKTESIVPELLAQVGFIPTNY